MSAVMRQTTNPTVLDSYARRLHQLGCCGTPIESESNASAQSISSTARIWPLPFCCTSVPFLSDRTKLQGNTCKFSAYLGSNPALLNHGVTVSLVTGDRNNYTWQELRHMIQLFASKDLKYTPIHPFALYALSHVLGEAYRNYACRSSADHLCLSQRRSAGSVITAFCRST